MINKNEWYRFSQNKGGHAIDFMKEFYGFSFAEAVKELLGEEGAGETNRRTGKEDISSKGVIEASQIRVTSLSPVNNYDQVYVFI